MALEDFTTYTENDANNRFAVSANTIAVTALEAEADENVGKDFGVDFFGDLPLGVEWDAEVTSQDNNAAMFVLVMTNTPEKTYKQHRVQFDNEPSFWCLFNQGGAGQREIIIQTFGTIQFNDFGAYSDSTRIYFKHTRSGTTFTVKMYSDSSRTTLTDTLAITSISTAFKHLFAVHTAYDILATGPATTGDIKNYELLDGTLSVGGGSYFVELQGRQVW